MKKLFAITQAVTLLLCSLLPLNLQAAENSTSDNAPKRGEITGGVPHAVPDWFKASFLDIRDDVDEATAAGRHVMLFFQLNACPYCDRMLTESFETEPLQSFIQEHFDVIAINVKGDREIAFNEELSVTEKVLSEKLNVRATPAILFLDDANNAVVRVDGYRSPERFKHILSYVSDQAYADSTLAEYLSDNLERGVYELRDDPLFQDLTNLSGVETPLAVIFEDDTCYDCAEFHDNLLAREEVRKELAPFTVVRLDANSETAIIDPEGNPTTPKDWAKAMEMTYRPGVLIYDKGKLLRRIDSLLFSFHFKEGFRYIGGGYYKEMPYDEYAEQRREELLSAGIDIDLGQ